MCVCGMACVENGSRVSEEKRRKKGKGKSKMALVGLWKKGGKKVKENAGNDDGGIWIKNWE